MSLRKRLNQTNLKRLIHFGLQAVYLGVDLLAVDDLKRRRVAEEVEEGADPRG